MGFSIQDYLKKINSWLTRLNCLSLLVTTLSLLFFLVFLYQQQKEENIPISYIRADNKETMVLTKEDSHPFGSINGKTYTFSWCQNSSMILNKNRIYFATEQGAKQSGRVLSKLCQK